MFDISIPALYNWDDINDMFELYYSKIAIMFWLVQKVKTKDVKFCIWLTKPRFKCNDYYIILEIIFSKVSVWAVLCLLFTFWMFLEPMSISMKFTTKDSRVIGEQCSYTHDTISERE